MQNRRIWSSEETRARGRFCGLLALYGCLSGLLACTSQSGAPWPDIQEPDQLDATDGQAGSAGDGDRGPVAGTSGNFGDGGGGTPEGGPDAAGGEAAGPGEADASGQPASGGDAAGDTDTAVGGGGGDLTGDSGQGSGPGDWGPGDYPPNLAAEEYLEIYGVQGQQGNVRQYKVHVPPSYDPQVPMPLVFCIHGLGQTPVLFCINSAKMPEKSDRAGFILVMPNGFQNSWNAGTCCGGASTAQLDDVALIRAIFGEVATHLNVDLDRVYATGLSNGGYLSYRLACEAADLFTAVAPGAGAIGINTIGGGTNPLSDFTVCEPSRPISVLDVHGTADALVPYTLQAPSMSLMQQANGCSPSTVPASQPASGGDTTCITHEGCPSGIELTACTVQGGGHCWFGTEDCGTGAGAFGLMIVGADSNTLVSTDAVWDFFASKSR